MLPPPHAPPGPGHDGESVLNVENAEDGNENAQLLLRVAAGTLMHSFEYATKNRED